MVFNALVASLVQSAFQIIDDLAVPITYLSNTSVTYDPNSGTVTPNQTTYTLQGVLSKFDIKEVDNKIVLTTDVKLLIAGLDLPVDPRENDQVTANGRQWKVVRVMGVPGDSFWKIQIREV